MGRSLEDPWTRGSDSSRDWSGTRGRGSEPIGIKSGPTKESRPVLSTSSLLL